MTVEVRQLLRRVVRRLSSVLSPRPASRVPVTGGPDGALFGQGEVWIGPDGVRHVLADLTPDSRAELAYWLEWHADHFYAQVLARELARDAFDVAGPSVSSMLFVSATEWLESTELMRTLRSPDLS